MDQRPAHNDVGQLFLWPEHKRTQQIACGLIILNPVGGGRELTGADDDHDQEEQAEEPPQWINARQAGQQEIQTCELSVRCRVGDIDHDKARNHEKHIDTGKTVACQIEQ